MPGLNAQLDDFLRTSAPALNESTPIKCFGDQRIPRPRGMIALQILDAQSKRQRTVTPNLKAIVVDCETHGAARDRVVTMAKCVHQCLPEGDRREQWSVGPFKHAGFNPA